jgi:hypothetical protein
MPQERRTSIIAAYVGAIETLSPEAQRVPQLEGLVGSDGCKGHLTQGAGI